jgi:hypothetical protein
MLRRSEPLISSCSCPLATREIAWENHAMRENPYQSPGAELESARTTLRRARLTRFFVSMALMLGYNAAMYTILLAFGMKLSDAILVTVVGALLLIRFLGKSWAAMEQRFASNAEM